jgi:hyperosmotically inducible periplasmic protein
MRIDMQSSLGVFALIAAGIVGGCSTSTKAPAVSGQIRQSLDQSGLKDVSVTQDRDNGVITLKGEVRAEGDKAQAEAVAKSFARNQVVANEIAVIPPGYERQAKTVNSDLDQGIDKNLDAALVQNRLHEGVKYDVRNGVVTLKGEVDSQSKRERVASVAASVPYVQQVVNEVQVKNQRATSSY